MNTNTQHRRAAAFAALALAIALPLAGCQSATSNAPSAPAQMTTAVPPTAPAAARAVPFDNADAAILRARDRCVARMLTDGVLSRSVAFAQCSMTFARIH